MSKKKQRTKKELYITKIFNNDLSAISKSKVRLKLTKPAYVAMCMLALSKLLIYKFRYDYIENEYGSNSKLLFTDTDSLRYEIKTEDVYENFSQDKEIFDFLNYSPISKFDDDSNNLVIDKMRDETGNVAVEEFV